MSEQDDIFDIENYLKKAPKSIQKIWDDHLMWVSDLEKNSDNYYNTIYFVF